MNTGRMKTRGFSLTELIVVAGITVVLTSVAVPAMQQARGDARAVACRNNLKQLGLAMHNYHDALTVLPPGWTNHYANAGAEPRFGLLTFVLPYVDHSPIYNRLNFSRPIPPPDELLQTPVRVYRCPADTTPHVNPLRGEYGTANYSGNFGITAPPRWLPGRLTAGWPGQADTPLEMDGLFCLNSSIRFRNITDGTSNTLLAGERCFTSGAGIWPGVGANEYENDQVTDCSPGNEINSGFAAFSSLHAGGANFLMCDGSVRFISEDIESKAGEGAELGTYQKLSNRHDGQVIGEF